MWRQILGCSILLSASALDVSLVANDPPSTNKHTHLDLCRIAIGNLGATLGISGRSQVSSDRRTTPSDSRSMIELSSGVTKEDLYSGDPRIQTFRPQPHRDVSGFVIGGVNSNETISNMKTLTGTPMEVLDARAQPLGGTSSLFSLREDNQWGQLPRPDIRQSGGGLVASGQKVKTLLLADNEWVLAQGLTHQIIAEPVLEALRVYESGDEKPKEFIYRGRRYKVEGKMMGGSYLPFFPITGTEAAKNEWREKHGRFAKPLSGWVGFGVQGSIFNDNLFANWEYKITDVETGDTLSGDALTPHLIYRYGFYQGGEYRNAPEKFAKFFHLLP